MLGRGFCLTSASVPAEWDAPVPSGRRGVSFARTVAALVLPADSLVSAGLASLVLVLSVFDFVAHSQDLLRVCNSKKKINTAQVWDCLFPKKVLNPDGSAAATRSGKYD
jgi:hypothetical protein